MYYSIPEYFWLQIDRKFALAHFVVAVHGSLCTLSYCTINLSEQRDLSGQTKMGRIGPRLTEYKKKLLSLDTHNSVKIQSLGRK